MIHPVFSFWIIKRWKKKKKMYGAECFSFKTGEEIKLGEETLPQVIFSYQYFWDSGQSNTSWAWLRSKEKKIQNFREIEDKLFLWNGFISGKLIFQ